MMESGNTDKNPATEEDNEPSSEHDYAHAVDGNAAPTEAPTYSGRSTAHEDCSAPTVQAQSTVSLPMELPDTVVGAEVDCPLGNCVEARALPVHVGEGPLKSGRAATRSVRPRASRPEDRTCCCCKAEFERHGRSFNRRAVSTFTTTDTVQWVFPGVEAQERSFMCEACAQVLRSKCKRKQTGRRSMWLKPSINQLDGKKKKGRRMGKKSKAAELVSKSCYRAAFKMLWSAKGARKPMMDFWCKQLKEEMKILSRQTSSPFHQKVSNRKPLSSFPWRRCLNWAQEKAPLVTTCLQALFPDLNALSKSSHLLSEEQAQMLLERRTLVALSIPLFTRNIWKNNFLQAALGAELRQQGCSGAALDALNTLGLCQNKDTVRLLLHRLRNGKKSLTQNGRQRMRQEEMKGEQMSDVEEDDIEEEEEEEVEEDEEEEEDHEDEIELAVEEEVEQEEVQDEVQEEDEGEDQEAEEKEKRRRRKKMKRERKEEKRKERGKRKAKQREQEEEEDGDGDEELVEKKRRVVVVRLGLLKGHSEVGRADLSAP